MATDNHIVDLLVRAQFQGKADIENVSKAIAKLSETIEEQGQAAKKGEASIDDLKAALAALKGVEDSLKGSSALLSRFKTLSQRIGETQEKIEKSTKAYAEYDAKLKSTEKVTDSQNQKFKKMGVALEKLSTTLINQVTQQQEYAQALESMGLATSDLVASETRLNTLKLSTAAAIGQAQVAMSDYTKDMKAAKVAAAELAAEQRKLQLATDAKGAAQEYTELARATAQAVPRVTSLSDALRGIADPAEQVRHTIAGTEAEISDLARSLTLVNQPAAQYREQMDRMAQAQRALQQQGVMIDTFRQQVLAVQAARQEFVKARAALLEYSEGVKTGAVSAQELAKAQKATEAAASGLNKQLVVARAAKVALKEVGIATDDLVRAQERIVASAQEAAAAMAQVGAQSAAAGAAKAIREFTTLANASADLAPRVTSLRDALRGIVDPAGEARRTVSGVEEQVRTLSQTIGKANVPMSEYREEVAQLVQAQKALQQQGSLIDTFRQQVAAVQQARQDFTKARAEVLQYAEGVRTGAVSIEKLTQAQNRLRGSATALQQQVAAARATKAALKEAGIASNDLVNAENRIVTATRSATAAIQNYNAALKAGSGASSGFEDGGRTTLSLMQRIRGEILALTASYVGLQGAIGLAGRSADTFNNIQGVQNQLKLSVGDDPAAAAAELEYLRGVTYRLGVNFEESSKAFARFSAAMRLAGRSSQEARYIYESFAEIGRVANLTTDDMNGVFKAIEQIYSKGTIQAEELKGQLGDRVFGAMQIAAKALADEFPNLSKAMETGSVSADQFLKIAEKYREMVQASLPEAIKSLSAEQQRFNNELTEFRLNIAESGWAESYLELLKAANEFLRSEQGADLAAGIGKAFSAIADSLRFLIENFEETALVFNSLVGLFAAFKFTQVIQAFWGFVTAVKAGTIALTAFSKIFGIISIVVLAWQIGSYLYDKFESVRMVVEDFITLLDKTWAGMKIGFELAVESLPKIAYNALATVINYFTWFGRKALGVMSDLAKAAGRDDIAKSIDATIGAITFDYKSLDGEIAKAAAEWQAEADRIAKDDAFRKLMVMDLPTGSGRSEISPTGKPDASKIPTAPKGPSEADLDKQRRAYEALLRQVEALEARVDKVRNNTLEQQLRGFDKDMLKMERQIKALGDPELAARFEKARVDARSQVIFNFNEKIFNEEVALRKKIEELDAAAYNKQKTSIEARKNAIITANAEIFRQIDELEQKLEANGRDTSGTKYMRAQVQAAQELQLVQAEAKAREEQVNAVIATREATLRRIAVEQRAGLKSAYDASEETKQVIKDTQPEIDKLTLSSLEWAMAMGDALTPEQLELFKAKMLQMQQSGKDIGKTWELTNDSMAQIASPAISQGIENIVDGFGEAIQGAQSFSDAIDNMGKVFLNIAAQILRELAVMILKMAFFNALKNSGNTALQAIGTAGASTMHTGGIVGRVQNRTRNVPTALFANAPRYHTGGVVGMSPDEYPAILQKNEEVLSAGDPRNILNAAGGGGASEAPQAARFVLVDDRSKVAEAMRGAEGESVTLLHLKRNIPTLRQLLK